MRKTLYLFAFSSLLTLAACGGSSTSDTQDTSDSSTNEAADTVQAIAPEAEPVQVAEAKPVLSEIETRGKVLYKRCVTCHTLEKDGRHKVGPNLYGVFGATAGVKEGFKFSTVMAESGIEWTDENLDAYIANPREFMPKNRMVFVGLRKPEDRQAVLAYMRKAMDDTPEE